MCTYIEAYYSRLFFIQDDTAVTLILSKQESYSEVIRAIVLAFEKLPLVTTIRNDKVLEI